MSVKGNISGIIKGYADSRDKCIWAENNRKRLVQRTEKMLGSPADADYGKACEKVNATRLAESDKNFIKNYVRAKIYTDVVETSIRERLEGRTAEIAEDSIMNGMSVEAASDKYGLSGITIKRIRRKAFTGIREEITLREEAGNDLSRVFPQNDTLCVENDTKDERGRYKKP